MWRPSASEQIRAALETTAKSRVGEKANITFVSSLQKDRTDIFARYPDGARAVAYYQYVVCGLLQNDSTLSASDRLDYLNKAFRALFAGSTKSYSEYDFLVLNEDGQGKHIDKAMLKRDGNNWLEIQLGKVKFTWDEVSRNDDYIMILHKPRQLQIKIPVNGGVSLMGYVGQDWFVWNEMHPVQ